MPTVIEKFVSEWELDVDQNSINIGISAIESISSGLASLIPIGQKAALLIAGTINKIAGETDKIGKHARDFGATTEEFQRLETAAGLAGVEFESVNSSIGRLSKNAESAIDGSKSMSEAFSELGINVGEFTKLSPTEKLLEISGGLKAIENPSKRASIKMVLLGQAGLKMGSLLDGGREELQKLIDVQDDFGVLITPENLAQAEKYNDSLLKVGKFTNGIAQTLTNKLLPVINPIIDKLLEWIKANKDLVNSKVEKFTNAIGKALQFTAAAIEILLKFTKKLTDSIGGFDNAVRLAVIVLAAFSAGFLVLIAMNPSSVISIISKAFRRLGAEALFANASVLLIPLAIGAIITLIGLLVEDFIAFRNGQDSLIGRLVDKYTWFAQVVGFLSQVAEDVGKSFVTMGDFIADRFGKLFDYLNDKTGGFASTILTVIKETNKAIAKFFGPVLKVAARLIGYDDATVADLNNLISGSFDFGIAAPSPRQQKINASNGVKVNSNTNITIVTQPGQDGAQIARMVDQKLDARDKDNARAIQIATSKGVKR